VVEQITLGSVAVDFRARWASLHGRTIHHPNREF
jgi:hypothetical protein